MSRSASVMECTTLFVSSRLTPGALPPRPSNDIEDVDARRVKALKDSRGQSNVLEELVEIIDERLFREKETSIGDVGAMAEPSKSNSFLLAITL
jgi:hypothetical protein